MSEPVLKSLGWENGWAKTPQVVENCMKTDHRATGAKTDVDEGPPFRGLKHHVVCRVCGYEYYYDSSG